MFRTVAALNCSRLWREMLLDPTGLPVTTNIAITQCKISLIRSFAKKSLLSFIIGSRAHDTLLKRLGACPSIRICRVPSAAWADARRCDAGNAGTLSRSTNEADAHAPPEPFGRMGVAGRSLRCSSSTMSPHRLLLAP